MNGLPQQYWVILTQKYNSKTGEKYEYDSVATLYDVDETAARDVLKQRKDSWDEN